MKKYYLPLTIVMLTFLMGCDTKEKTIDKKNTAKIKMQPVSINNEYTMAIPEFMTKATSLNEAASLQYQNIFRETYVIVIDEDKDEFINAVEEADIYDSTLSVIEQYADTQIQSLTANVDVINQDEIKSFKINGLNAKSIEIDANLKGVKFPITYFLNFVEGRQKLYFVMAWTLQDRKDKHRQMFQDMVSSFRVFKQKS